MRWFVDGKETTKAAYDLKPAGKSRAAVTIDDDHTIALSYIARIRAIEDGKADPCEADELLTETAELDPDVAAEFLTEIEDRPAE